MKDTLIINLKRFGDIFAMSNLVDSMVASNNDTTISLLVFKEFLPAAKTIKNVSNIYTLDRKEILGYRHNPIFSDGFAFEAMFNQLQDAKKTTWDRVINYSNDPISAHLTSYLTSNSSQHTGIKISTQRNAIPSSEWDMVFNDVLTEYKHTPLNFVDCYHRMLNIPFNGEGIRVRTNTSHNEAAFKNISYIKKQESLGNKEAKIVGVQLFASNEHKSLLPETLSNIIDDLLFSEEYYPVLLIAPTEKERAFAKEINTAFDNKLISVEADFSALSSVLMNIDYVITPDTAVKHLADLVETPCVELSLGSAPLFKQGSINTESIIISPIVSKRSFSISEIEQNKELQNQNSWIKASDVLAALDMINPDTEPKQHKFSTDLTIYKPYKDSFGTRYKAVAGDINENAEISRLMSRQLVFSLFKLNSDNSIYSELVNFDHKILREWTVNEKNAITDVTKDLLASLRSLLQITDNKKIVPLFINSLDSLLAHCNSDKLIGVTNLMFRSKLEALDTGNITQSVKEVEALLYELKGDIQRICTVIKDLEEKVQDKRKLMLSERITNRTEEFKRV